MRSYGNCGRVAAFVAAAVVLVVISVAGAAEKKGTSRKVAKTEPLLVPLASDQLINAERALAVRDGKVLSLAYSPDGTRLAAGGDDKTVAVWELRTGGSLWSMKDLPDKVTGLCFSADGSMLATAGRDKELYIWDAGQGGLLASFKVKDDIRALACSPRGEILAAALDDRTVLLWDLAQVKGSQAVRSVDGEKEGGSRLLGLFRKLKERKKEQVQATGDKALLKVLRQEKDETISLAFSPDGAQLATAGKNGRLFLWDIRQGSVARTIEGAEKELTALAFSPDGAMLAAVEDGRRIMVWDLRGGGAPRAVPPTRDDLQALSFSADGSLLATAGKKRVALWGVKTLKELHTLPEQEKDVLAVLFSPTGGRLATAGEERQIRLWNVPGIITLAGSPAPDEAIAALEQERDRKIQGVAISRGEFETSMEYEARLKRSTTEETLIRKEYDERIRSYRTRRTEEAERLKRQLYPYTLRVKLGSYDADKGTFPVQVGEKQIAIPVPVGRAKELARHRDNAVIVGQIRYYAPDRAELVNAALLNQESGERFPFGFRVSGTADAGTAVVAGNEGAPRRSLPKLLIANVALVEPSGNGALDAGERGTIRVTLKNEGKGPAEGVILSVQPGGAPPTGVQVAEKTFVGSVGPGETKSLEVEIAAGEEVSSQEVRLQVTALDAAGFDSRPVAMAFSARAMIPPELQVVKVDISDADGRRVISRGKEVNLTLTVRNAGNGPARGVTATIEVGDPNVKLFGDGEIPLGTLKPGEAKRAAFTVAVTQRYGGEKALPISFSIGEERPRFAVQPQVRLALDEEAPQIRLVKIEAMETPPQRLAETDDIGVAPLIAASRRVFTERDLAVVVGIERYQSVPKSDYAYNDARAVKAYLLSLGFAERNIEFLADERATLSAIRKSVETWLPNRVKKGSRIFFYYSGHGAPDPASGEAYLVPYDGDPGYLADTGYPLKRLYEKLGAAKAAEVMVVMDSCFSGSGGRSVLAKGARPLVLSGEGPAIPQKMAVLSSTQGSQISTSFDEKEHGVFTYYFLRAIKEGKHDIGETYQFVKPLVEDTAKSRNVTQSPSLSTGESVAHGSFQLLKQ